MGADGRIQIYQKKIDPEMSVSLHLDVQSRYRCIDTDVVKDVYNVCIDIYIYIYIDIDTDIVSDTEIYVEIQIQIWIQIQIDRWMDAWSHRKIDRQIASQIFMDRWKDGQLIDGKHRFSTKTDRQMARKTYRQIGREHR